jgi:hypothetical protein
MFDVFLFCLLRAPPLAFLVWLPVAGCVSLLPLLFMPVCWVQWAVGSLGSVREHFGLGQQ